MAKYHSYLKYHDDAVIKRPITENEIAFLAMLQKEMNTQDTVGQADPRFWVIKGSEKEYGIETGFENGADLVLDDSSAPIATDMESAVNYIRDNFLDEINDSDGIQRSISLEDGIFHQSVKISWRDNGTEEWEKFDNMEELSEWLKDQGYDCRVANYRIVEKIYPNTMFLTQRAAEDHLRANHYHYSEDAHTYAMTAWRSEQADMLYKILHEVDWEAML